MNIKSVVIGICIVLLGTISCKNKQNHSNNSNSETEHELAFPHFSEEDFKDLGNVEIDSSTQKMLANFYHYFWEGNDLSGQFLVAQGNQIIYQNHRGFANIADSIPITENTPIHIASISKNLTAMMILHLIEKKKLKLQQKVQTILKDFPYKEITIFELLTHRSGLGNYDFYAEDLGYSVKEEPFTNRVMYKMYAECKPSLIFPSNTQHSYCNTNYAFLALIIEEITEMSYPEAMKKLMFEPLGMKNSYVFQEKDYKTATLSYFNNKKVWKWDFRDLIYGDKNIYTTTQDLFRYSEAMFTEKFMRKSLMDSAMIGYSNERKGIKNYGFGFRMREFENGSKLTFHTGSWHGNNTIFVHLPREKVTIIALGNRKSRANYSAFSLSSVFGDYPLEVENKDELSEETDTIEIDSLQDNFMKDLDQHLKQKNEERKLEVKKTSPKPKVVEEIKEKPVELKKPDSIIPKKENVKIPKPRVDSIKKAAPPKN